MKNEEILSGNGLATYLPVESVQALASKDLDDIPARYIRPELESDVVITDESLEIHVIDMSRLLDQQFMYEELKKLHSACEDWGFFQLINHQVPEEEVVEKMKVDVKEFFKLPLEKKKADCSPLPGVVEGYGQAFVLSEEQKLDWGDMLFLHTQPFAKRNMTIWPKQPTSFRTTLDKYASELRRVTDFLIGCMAKNLGADPEKLKSMFDIGYQGVRMNYYPPCAVKPDKVLGISPHSDASGLTLLIQVNEVHGLQIKNKGKWVPIKPIPGAFIVNIGDLIEIISNGKYKSIEHRAVINPLKERMSIATFHYPYGETIGPLPEIVKMTGGEEKYKTISYAEYLKLMYSTTLDGKNQLGFMKY